MSDFSNVSSGFDFEVLLDKDIIKHLIQLFTDSENSIRINGVSLFKNFSDVNRDYTPVISEIPSADTNYFNLKEFTEAPDYFYVAVNPFDFTALPSVASIVAGLNGIYIVIRIKKRLEISEFIRQLKANEDADLYDVMNENLRIEGLIAVRAFTNSSDTLAKLNLNIRQMTHTLFDQLVQLSNPNNGGGISLSQSLTDFLLSPFVFDTDDAYESFLKSLHETLKIPLFIKDAVKDINPAFPFLPQCLNFVPYVEQGKIGIYGNFNTINASTRGDVANAEIFATDNLSGIGLSLSEALIQDILLSMFKFEMQKQLDSGEITQERFDNIDYSYPFAFPGELLKALELPKKASYFDIKEVKFAYKEHKFPDQEEKMDAVKLEIILSNDDNGFFEAVWDVIVPNPHITLYFGFEKTDSGIKVYMDGDVNIPFNLFAVMLTSVITLIIGNIVLDNKTHEYLKKVFEHNLALSLIKKRWDPFYLTHHCLKFHIDEILINKETQIRLTCNSGLSKSFEPYQSLYLSQIQFNNDFPQHFRYYLNSVSDVLTELLPATDRIEDIYTISSLSNVIEKEMDSTVQTMLVNRASLNKIYSLIPYSPQFVRLQDGSVELIKVLSNLRRDEIKFLLLENYLNNEVKKIVDLFLKLVNILVPGFDAQTVTEEQLAEVTSALEKLVLDSGTYSAYNDTGWKADLITFLQENPSEMLTLSPKQLVFLGMQSASVVGAFISLAINNEEIFRFMDMPGYQAIFWGDNFFIRNAANDTRRDNILTLPEF